MSNWNNLPKTLAQAVSLVTKENYKKNYNRLLYQVKKYNFSKSDKEDMLYILSLTKTEQPNYIADYAYSSCDTLIRDVLFETFVLCSGHYPDYKPRF